MKSTKKVIIIFNIIFILLAGLFRILEWYFSNLYLETLSFFAGNAIYLFGTFFWFATIRKRILDKKVKGSLFVVCFYLVALIIVKMFKYRIVSDITIERYLNYGYYILLLLIVYQMIIITSFIGRPVGYQLNKKIWLTLIPTIILCVILLCNDLHEFNYRVSEEGKYSIYIGQYLLLGYVGIELIGFIVIIMNKCTHENIKKKSFIPLGIFILSVGYYVSQFLLEGKIRLPFAFADFALIAIIGFIESFIRIGLIRSNEYYVELFNESSLNSFITDYDKNIYYKSKNANTYSKEDLEKAISSTYESNDIRLNYMSLKNSLFFYEENLKQINELNKNLQDISLTLDEENEIIHQYHLIKEKKLRLKEDTTIYQEISEIISPSVNYIEETIKDLNPEDKNYEEKVSKAVFIISYIKRRINLTLLSKSKTGLRSQELEYSLSELISTYKLNNIEASYNIEKGLALDNNYIISYFDYIYKILLDNISNMEACLINVSNNELRINADIDEEEKSFLFQVKEVKADE